MIPKFRAWDTTKKEMFKDTFAITESGQVVVVDQSSVFVSPDYVFVDNLVIMQSTGLKDKNGKEIFEGDILKNNKYITSVFYEDGAYRVKFCRTLNTTVTMNVISFIEKYKTRTVGNIYENPELLEVKSEIF